MLIEEFSAPEFWFRIPALMNGFFFKDSLNDESLEGIDSKTLGWFETFDMNLDLWSSLLR